MDSFPHDTRPELRIYRDSIVFVYPPPETNPADHLDWELWRAIPAFFLPLIPGVVLLAVALEIPQDQAPAGGWLAPFIIGCVFVAVAPLLAWWKMYRYRNRERLVLEALDRIHTELSVEAGRLIRRYASGRKEVWLREKITDVVVEEQRETDGEGQVTAIYCLLSLSLRCGAKGPFLGRALRGTLRELDLHWMAGELRRALQVPYDAPPLPMEGAVIEHSADGITIRVPHEEPAAVWRQEIWNCGQLIVGLSSFLLFAAGLSTLCVLFDDGPGLKWEVPLFILGCIPFVAICFGTLMLMQIFNKTQEVDAIADRTITALGVGSGKLFRRHASGRENDWPDANIAAVRVERVKDRDEVQMILKSGEVIHLFGDVPALDTNKLQREGLIWLAQELSRGLAQGTAEPPANVEEAIVDLGAAESAQAPHAYHVLLRAREDRITDEVQ